MRHAHTRHCTAATQATTRIGTAQRVVTREDAMA